MPAPPASLVDPMPKFWIYTQVLIVLFVVAGMVIAITRLA
jgi:hypothetical protein